MNMSFTLLLSIFLTSIMNSCTTEDKAVLEYKVRMPLEKTQNPPLLILFHGVGSNEQDLFSLADYLPKKYVVISARAPITLGTNSYGWYRLDLSTGKPIYDFKEAEESRKKIIQFIEQMSLKYATKPGNIYLCGFSQGAIMSYSIALANPELISGVAAMSGRLLEEIKPFAQSKNKLAHLKFHIAHGTNDRVLPYQNAVDADAYLKTLGLNPSFHSYSAAHEINSTMLQDLVKWLE